ncbi:MAG: hypothetical protein GY719_30555, partial [bacterium]|nr:hypothetical protein [bacterium]
MLQLWGSVRLGRGSGESSSQAFRNFLIVLWAGCLLFPAMISGQPNDAEILWAAGPGGVVAIEPGAGSRLEVPETSGARLVALDAERGSVWVASDESLARFDASGELLWRQKLETVPVALVVVPEDGSIWIAGDRLDAFGAGGQRLGAHDLGARALGLALDETRSLVWVATAESLSAHDAIGGALLRSLDPGSLGDLRSFALDPASGRIWAAAGDRLLRFDAEGTRDLVLSRGAMAATRALLGDGHGGSWAIENSRLSLLGPDGEELLSRAPFGDEGEIAAWTLDAGTRSLWLTDGRELVRLSASGLELDRRPLAGADGQEAIFGLAAGSAVDVESPMVAILAPASGTVAKTARPRIVVRYNDDRSGVRSGTLRISVDGAPAPASCDFRAGGATCELDSSLPAGSARLEVTVADEMGNVSAPAVALFEVAANRDAVDEDLASKDKGPGDSKIKIIPGGDPVYTPIVSPRGFRPNVPFLSASEVDHVDTASGNLVVTIPLGQVYTVGPTLEYQIRPVYNSNLWQHIEFGCPQTGCPPPLRPITFGSTNYAANAGLGWELHFGRLYGPNTPQSLPSGDRQRWPNQPRDLVDMNDRWMYVAPSGAVTYLHSLSGRNNGTASNPVRYSKTGPHTRMRQVSSSEIQVHQPNGLISVFETTNSMAGTEFCGGGTLQCWRFKELRDAYGNYMRVTYSLNGTTETWNVTDSTGRAHKIIFSHSHGDTAGGDGVAPDITQDDDEIGDLRKVVKKVELAAFGSQKATYDFLYTTRTLQRGHPHDERNELPQHADEIRTRVLDRITVPESQPWKFTTFTTSNPYFNGRLIEATGPSRGRIAWEYTNAEWYVPTRCTYHNVDPGSVEWDYASTGVKRRISKKPNGTVEGTWTYESDLYPLRSQLPLYGSNCARANYRKTVVNAAADANGKHTRTVYYNSVATGPRLPSSSTPIDQWQVTDGGLPFSKDFKTGSSTSTRRFLSRQIYHCSGGSCGSAKRSIYVRYANEWRGAQCNKSLGDSGGCYQANPLLVAERTIFHDDGGKYIDVEHQQYNGAGNLRRTVTKDNFSGSTKTRTDTTNYTATGSTTLGINGTTGYISLGNPSSYLPSPTSRWILHPFSKKTAAENGRTYVTEFQFNGQGSMTCSRKWKSSGGRGGKDLVVKLGIGGNGLATSETVAGGEGASLSSSLCATNGSASSGSRYVLKHEYQHLQLKRTYIDGYPNWYRAAIDRNTGLPSVTYNAADQSTSHSYDKLGRLKSSTPTSSLGQARTEIVYRNPSTGDPSVETSRKSTSGSLLTRETQV